MKVGIVLPESYEVFSSLLLPEVAAAAKAGEPVTVLGLTDGSLAVGAAAGYLDSGRFQLISFYIAPEYRRRGGGRALIDALRRILPDSVFAIEINFTQTEEEHETLHPFLAALGFYLEDNEGENIYVTTLETVLAAPFFSRAVSSGATPFAELSDSVLDSANTAALAAGAPLPEGGLLSPRVDRDVSVAYVKGGKVCAYLAADHSCCGFLTAAAAWTGSAEPMVLSVLLRSMAANAGAKYPAETNVAFQTVNSASTKLIKMLLPDIKPISYTYVAPFTRESEKAEEEA